jgi:replicative DNA helicase
MVVFIDLATMMEDFADKSWMAYEQAMNKLHQMAKRTRVHLVLIVQANNKVIEKSRPANIEGLRAFNPPISSIRNSGAIADRSRQVISVFRQHYYALKYFPEDPLVQEEDDILDVNILKCNNGLISNIHYLYDGEFFRVYPIPEDYAPITAAELRRQQLGEQNDGEI